MAAKRGATAAGRRGRAAGRHRRVLLVLHRRRGRARRRESRLAGDYKGLDQLQELFGQFMEAMGEYSSANYAYLADDEHGVILQRRKAVKEAQTHESTSLVHFRDEKISEICYVPVDQAAVDGLIG